MTRDRLYVLCMRLEACIVPMSEMRFLTLGIFTFYGLNITYTSYILVKISIGLGLIFNSWLLVRYVYSNEAHYTLTLRIRQTANLEAKVKSIYIYI